jgi:hypothetical protein
MEGKKGERRISTEYLNFVARGKITKLIPYAERDDDNRAKPTSFLVYVKNQINCLRCTAAPQIRKGNKREFGLGFNKKKKKCDNKAADVIGL